MMRKVVVKSGQTLWDIAVEHCGSAVAALEMARFNGLVPTSRLVTGSILLVPDPIVGKTAEYYNSHGIAPASDTREGTFSCTWGDPMCVQEAVYYVFSWTDPECVQSNPYAYIWSESICAQEEGPYHFQWTEYECVQASTVYLFRWSNQVCALEEPYTFNWSDGHCVLAEGPYGFTWSNAVCVLSKGPYGFTWSNGVCAQYYDNTIEWGIF